MFGAGNKNSARRAEIRKNRPDSGPTVVHRLRAGGGMTSLLVAGGFCLATIVILLMREDVVRYRPGQWTRNNIVSRVDFTYRDEKQLAAAHQAARAATPRVYKLADTDPWKTVQEELLALPDRVKGMTLDEVPPELKSVLDVGSLSKIQEYDSGPQRAKYEEWVNKYIADLRGLGMVIIPTDQREEDFGHFIVIPGAPAPIRAETTLTPKMSEEIAPRLNRLAVENFPLLLQSKIVALTLRRVSSTHLVDEAATVEAKNRAEQAVPSTAGDVEKKASMTIVDVAAGGGEIKQEDWLLLKAENDAYLRTLGSARWGQRAGLAGIVLLITIIMSAYVARFQKRIVRNHMRAMAIALLMLSMLLLAQLAALGSSTLYFFGTAPTILVAMILAIAYDQRFALGMATLHAVLVTIALNTDVSSLLILESGVVTCCFLMDDLRTRSKLIEIGGATAMAMIAATAAAGFLQFDPMQYIARNCLYAGAAGLADGFVVLGILPFIEKAFRITTAMTLLELADASQPLLRRLSLEAPGTYNHSLQVATLAEEAADTIGANSLLCRVGAYYHDIGKINKADYFVENQSDGTNRHINLSPSVSLLIIIGHVKDGIEMAREYNLPTSLFPFIQQHHGTTLVEFFYQRACDTTAPDQPNVDETQYRYPGPKPKTKEIAILMLSDAVESACRAMPEPTASRIETLVHEIAMRRLQDRQFDESDLTMRDLESIERSLVKTLLGIYHGRIAYPSTSSITSTSLPPAAKTA
jgi:putative nucleotidyltransferase with HDIG domain